MKIILILASLAWCVASSSTLEGKMNNVLQVDLVVKSSSLSAGTWLKKPESAPSMSITSNVFSVSSDSTGNSAGHVVYGISSYDRVQVVYAWDTKTKSFNFTVVPPPWQGGLVGVSHPTSDTTVFEGRVYEMCTRGDYSSVDSACIDGVRGRDRKSVV